MTAGQHRAEAERLTLEAARLTRDGKLDDARTAAALAQAHATIAQADAVSTVAHWLEPRR